MPFTYPQSLYLLLIIPLIILLHLIKPRPEEYLTPTYFLWVRLARSSQARTFWQNLFRNLLTPLLQILIVSALVLALAQPDSPQIVGRDKPVVIVLDNSASMQAEFRGKTRFAYAQETASQLIGRLGGRRILLASAAKGLSRIFPLTGNYAQLKANLSQIKFTHGTDDWDSLIPAAIAQCPEPPQIYLISDGAQSGLKGLLSRYPQLNLIQIGGPVENVGIIGLEPRRNLTRPNLYQVLVTVKNYTRTAKTAALILEGLQAGEIRRQVNLSPDERKELIFEADNPGEAVLKAGLEADDDYKPDNYAAAILPPIKSMLVLLVNVHNPYLKQALQVIPQVQTQAISIQQYEELISQVPLSGYDLAVFQDYSPRILAAEDNVIWGTGVSVMPIPAEPADKSAWQESHPILDYVNLTQIQLKNCQPLPLFKPYSRILFSRRSQPLVAYDTYPASRVLRIGFRLEDSDFALNASFPIFWLNIIRQVTRRSPGKWAQLMVGEAYRLPQLPDPQGKPVPATLTIPGDNGPAGITEPVKIAANAGYYYPSVSGIYHLECSQFTARFAVKLDSQESEVTPASGIRSAELPKGGIMGLVLGYLKLWHVLALVALGLIVIEWWYQRERIHVY